MKKHKCIIEKKQLMGKNYHLFLFQQRMESEFNKGTQIGYKCAREKEIASSLHCIVGAVYSNIFFQNYTSPPCHSVLFRCKEITSNRIR